MSTRYAAVLPLRPLQKACTAMPEILLSVNNLHKSFGERQAVKAVSFQLARGQTLGLLGPNGAGKSTTVSMICGLLKPDQGDVILGGQRVAQGNNAAKQMMGLVPQDLALYDDLSARENLRIFGALYGLTGATLKSRCAQVLDLVQLSDRLADKPSTFSGGMKRRLNIAAALLHTPQLLILDEPTVGVDPQSRNAIFDSLEALKRQGCALIYTSHYMEEVERLADHIVIIDHGVVIADESPAALYQRLPAKAALRLTPLTALPEHTLDALKSLEAVADVALDGTDLLIGLTDAEQAQDVMLWLTQQGCRSSQFSTARTSLEAIFLTLTGRSLRDA
ncbi:MAG: ABC transporter ATP-binding protein [Rhodoferax sp.]